MSSRTSSTPTVVSNSLLFAWKTLTSVPTADERWDSRSYAGEQPDGPQEP